MKITECKCLRFLPRWCHWFLFCFLPNSVCCFLLLGLVRWVIPHNQDHIKNVPYVIIMNGMMTHCQFYVCGIVRQSSLNKRANRFGRDFKNNCKERHFWHSQNSIVIVIFLKKKILFYRITTNVPSDVSTAFELTTFVNCFGKPLCKFERQ